MQSETTNDEKVIYMTVDPDKGDDMAVYHMFDPVANQHLLITEEEYVALLDKISREMIEKGC